ncbi:hypothetical protein B0I35DRAFT_478230 [Stachybotrys elegans]|uniref:Uncharacterized protein n=1 Tax=Stachybotrys elegans TaxID=80388 RepID=A0A8K0SNJ4_9HYPO|nr:hypothetical protein B0I35DRAFT_478230 [Stachybotrys elegans]
MAGQRRGTPNGSEDLLRRMMKKRQSDGTDQPMETGESSRSAPSKRKHDSPPPDGNEEFSNNERDNGSDSDDDNTPNANNEPDNNTDDEPDNHAEDEEDLRPTVETEDESPVVRKRRRNKGKSVAREKTGTEPLSLSDIPEYSLDPEPICLPI